MFQYIGNLAGAQPSFHNSNTMTRLRNGWRLVSARNRRSLICASDKIFACCQPCQFDLYNEIVADAESATTKCSIAGFVRQRELANKVQIVCELVGLAACCATHGSSLQSVPTIDLAEPSAMVSARKAPFCAPARYRTARGQWEAQILLSVRTAPETWAALGFLVQRNTRQAPARHRPLRSGAALSSSPEPPSAISMYSRAWRMLI